MTDTHLWYSGPAVLLLGAATLLGSTELAAQRPSSWQSLSAPGIQPANVDHRGKLLLVSTAGQLHVFSSFVRQWRSRAVTGAAATLHTNDWLALIEAGSITAFSSMRARFETIAVSPAASVLNPSGQINDSILLVLDGARLSAFSGLIGQWVHTTISPSAAILTQRDVAVVADGTRLLGMSALFAAWVPLQASESIATVDADGTVAVAEGATTVYGFSAIQNRWASTAALPGGTRVQQRDFAVWHNPIRCLGFSGVRGVFATAVPGVPTQVTSSDSFAVADTGNGSFWFFSAPQGSWANVSLAGPASLVAEPATALLTEMSRVHAYSALSGTTATLPVANAVTAVNAALAAAVDPVGQTLHLYSAITGRWHQAPASAQVSLPALARNGALIVAAGARIAFSARTGRFISLPASGQEIAHVDLASSILAVEDGATLSVFEPRREVWLSQATQGGPLTVRIWRTTLCAVDQSEAYGFSGLHGALEKVAFAGPAIDQRASSEVGAVITANEVVAFGAIPSLTTLGQFPEFRRMYGRGTTIELHLVGPASANVGVVAGIPAQSGFTLPFGELLLRPGALIPLPMGPIGLDGFAVLPIPVPDNPALAGLRLGFQAAVLPTTSAPYLTRLAAVAVY